MGCGRKEGVEGSVRACRGQHRAAEEMWVIHAAFGVAVSIEEAVWG